MEIEARNINPTYTCPSNHSNQICEFTISSQDNSQTNPMYFHSRYQQIVKCRNCKIPEPFTYFNYNANDYSCIDTIDFSFSHIQDLTDHSFFDQTDQIQTLNLSFNEIHLMGRPKLFHNTPGLRNLNLGHNRILYILSDVFLGLPKLEMLDLCYNFLSSLPSDLFAPLVNLKIFNLESNDLVAIHLTQFKTNIHLTSLNLNNNKIVKFSKETLSTLKEMNYFNMAGNLMDSFKPIFAGNENGISVEVKQLLSENEDLKMELIEAQLYLDQRNKTFDSFRHRLVVLENYMKHINGVVQLQEVVTDGFDNLVRNITTVLKEIIKKKKDLKTFF